MPTPQDVLYFAIRKTCEGKEWIDIETWGYEAQTPLNKAADCNAKIPQWAKDNQVVRIARFRLVEID